MSRRVVAGAREQWWSVLLVSSEPRSELTAIRKEHDVDALVDVLRGDAVMREGAQEWRLAMIIGAFSDERSADDFIEKWADGSRGIISRASKGEACARLYRLSAYADFKAILRDEHAYDYVRSIAEYPEGAGMSGSS